MKFLSIATLVLRCNCIFFVIAACAVPSSALAANASSSSLASSKEAAVDATTPAVVVPSSPWIVQSRDAIGDKAQNGGFTALVDAADTVHPDFTPAKSSPFIVDEHHRSLGDFAFKDCLAEQNNIECPPCFFTQSCCMQANYNIYTRSNDKTTTCGSQSVDFQAVTEFEVHDANSFPCNCGSPGGSACVDAADEVDCEGKPNGSVFGACLGNDDNVLVSFKVDVTVNNAEYDVGMYINTDGGHAATGDECLIAGISDYAGIVGYADGDTCLDFITSGDLVNYPFDRILLSCTDSNGDGLLDFHTAVSFSQSAGDDCTLNSTQWDGSGLDPPIPGTTSKCWMATDRTTLNINVPGNPTPSMQPSISSQPSLQPSISAFPSTVPSGNPSISVLPSQYPSTNPSISTKPSTEPSSSPSTLPSTKPSQAPSVEPSAKPSISTMPSQIPSMNPSISTRPTTEPSSSPSTSQGPSLEPSAKPSISNMPSQIPSMNPSISTKPSQYPSTIPSISPTTEPSYSPSTSQKPSTSQHPSSNTRWPSSMPTGDPSASPSSNPTENPSFFPSVSIGPTPSPSDSPSTSKAPSSNPTYAPSSQPSSPPTGALYYPDWIHDTQVCINDGWPEEGDPVFMQELQRDNYLYRSKQECCAEHFWWRITQCMDNNHPMYYSNGEHCEQKVEFEDWEIKYTPGSWESSDLFETLRDCCKSKFGWNVSGCIGDSPKELVFDLTFDLKGLIEPSICQDADTIANALEVAMDIGLGGGDSNVTSIGCVTLKRNPDTGNPECGGCLEGTTFEGDYDGTREAGYFDVDLDQVTNISVEVSSNCDAGDCSDSTDMQALYDQILSDFTVFLTTGQLETEIHSWAMERSPPVRELWSIEVDMTSFHTDGTFTDPLNDPEDTTEALVVTMTGELSVPDLNQEIEVVKVTTAGSFSVSNLDTSLFGASQTAEVSGFFENAITQQLESIGLLPPGFIVTITSINNGAVQYEIVTYADSSADATSAVSDIQSSMASSLASITSSVFAASQSSSTDPNIASAMVSTSINSYSSGQTTTPTTTSKVITEGEFNVNNFDPSSFDPDQTDEAKDYFENALTQELTTQGLLPLGASVTVTGLSDDGTVQYEIHFYGGSMEDSGTAITSIESSLSDASTLYGISDIVQGESATSTTGISTSLSSVSITQNTKVSTTGITMTVAEEEEAKANFADAITSSLGVELPEGASITVTNIKNGAVSYFITMNVDSSADASAAVASIEMSLSNTSTLEAITTLVTSASPNVMAGRRVASNFAGSTTESTLAKVTSSGQLTTNLSGLSPDEVTEALEYFEDSIAAALQAAGALPAGATVSVTDIDSNGVVSYTITMYLPPGADNAVIVTDISSKLGLGSTLSAISSSVASDATSSSSTALSSLTVTGFIAGETRGVSFKQWYPNFVSISIGSYCVNNGYQPPFMEDQDNAAAYLFATQRECCEQWFQYAPDCVGSSGDKNEEKYYPSYSTNGCSKKKVEDFETYEQDRYKSLEECCSAQFPYSRQGCCDSPGMGGCVASGEIVYMPNWENKKCDVRSKETLALHEESYAKGSEQLCCSAYFDYWSESNDCLQASS